MRSLTVRSPAKVNLFLKVLGRRPDGYHEISTLFHRISLADRLVLKKTKRRGFRLVCDHPALRSAPNNLIAKAHQLLRRSVPAWKGGVEVRLWKRIPIAAGLGGGSSNAAHFLLGMNRLFDLGLPVNTLVRIGAQIGSDVPFFLYNINQGLGKGRGEKITPLPFKKKLWFLIVQAPFQLSTRMVYQRYSRLRLTRISHDATMSSSFFRRLERVLPAQVLVNDLFRASSAVRPELKEMNRILRQAGVRKQLMSGSGPTMFSIHPSRKEAARVAAKVRRTKPALQVFICHTF